MPSGDVHKKLADFIYTLSKQYLTPVFEPHISLVEDIVRDEEEIISKTEKLASLIKPFTVKLSSFGYEDTYFRSLFVDIEESPEIMKTNSLAKEIFNIENDLKFKPHLSLMYGENIPMSVKEKIVSSIGNKLNIEFEAKSIFIYKSDDRPEKWERVKEIPLLKNV